jgi:hypothetical protein
MRKADLRRAKRDTAFFSEQVLYLDGRDGRPQLHDYQLRVLTDPAPTVVWPKGRGAGGTEAMAVYAIWRAWTEPNHRVVYVSAGQRQAQEVVLEKFTSKIVGTQLEGDLVLAGQELVKLRNGSSLHFLPGQNSTAVRGFHARMVRSGERPSVTVILDESAFLPEATYNAAKSLVNAAPAGKWKMFITGSPRGTNSFFYREFEAGMDPLNLTTAAYWTSAEICPHIPESTIEDHRQKMSPQEFACEIQGQFVASVDSFFAEHVDPATRAYALPQPHVDGLQYGLGIDLSSSARLGSDFTVLCVVARWWGADHVPEVPADLTDVEPFIRVVDVRRFQYLAHAELRAELRDLVATYPALYFGIVETYESMALEEICKVIEAGEVVSLGTGEIDLTVERLTPTNPLQRESFSNVHRLLRNQELQLPVDGVNADVLLRELRGFTFKTTERGTITYSAPSGLKDDTVYALNWAVHAVRHLNVRSARSADTGDECVVVGSMREHWDGF